jgi:hypothetical protein
VPCKYRSRPSGTFRLTSWDPRDTSQQFPFALLHRVDPAFRSFRESCTGRLSPLVVLTPSVSEDLIDAKPPNKTCTQSGWRVNVRR